MKSIAVQVILENLPQNSFLSNTNDLHTDRRMKVTQEATNKSDHLTGECIVIGGYAKTI